MPSKKIIKKNATTPAISGLPPTLLSPAKTMFIIGNSQVKNDLSSAIDAADIVIRFNDMNNYNLGTGTKTTFWVLSSNKFLINQQIAEHQKIGENNLPGVKDKIGLSKSLLFSIPPFLPPRTNSEKVVFNRIIREDKKERLESVSRFLEYFEAEDHSFRIIEFPDKYINDLAPEIWSPKWTCPSNGYLITRMFVDDPTYYKHTKCLVGFTWEGWDGHPWILERLYLEKMERDNLLSIFR